MKDNKQMTNNKSVAKKIFDIIITIILIVYIVFSLVVCAYVFISSNSSDGVPSIFGKYFLTIETDSMEPTLKVGDLIICDKLSKSERLTLKEGDIISFWSVVYKEGQDFNYIKDHRIIEVIKDENDLTVGYITKGDNAPEADSKISVNDVLAKYDNIKINGAGKVFNFLKSQNGILFCLVIPLAAFFIYAIFKFVKALMEYKIAKNPESVLSEEQKQKAIEEYLASQNITQNAQNINNNNYAPTQTEAAPHDNSPEV